MSDEERRRLLAGDYSPIDLGPDEPRPEVGDVCVLKVQKATASVSRDGFVSRTPEHPVLYLTVTSVQRHRKGFWRVRFDVTDLRDPVKFLRRIGGFNPDEPASHDELQAGALPPPEWLEAHAKMIASYWTRRRLEQQAEARRERGRAQRRRAA